ncbi:MAG: DedA family protein [Bdellovibrionota bacterium]
MDIWFLQFDGFMLYWILFAALLGGAIGLPLPEDLILIIGGLLAHQGRVDLGLVFLFCYCGIILGDMIIFFVGMRFGPNLFQKEWFQKRISRKRLRKTRVRLERKSFPMIFFARHVPYLRTVTFLTCGAVKMKPLTFLISDSLSALVSAPIMIGLGYFASESFDAVTTSVNMFYRVLFVLTVTAIIIYAVYKYRQGKR